LAVRLADIWQNFFQRRAALAAHRPRAGTSVAVLSSARGRLTRADHVRGLLLAVEAILLESCPLADRSP